MCRCEWGEKLAGFLERLDRPTQVLVRSANPSESVMCLRAVRMLLENFFIKLSGFLPSGGSHKALAQTELGTQVIRMLAQRHHCLVTFCLIHLDQYLVICAAHRRGI